MLLAATVDDSDSVFVDLLTYADLEALKSKRAGAPPRAAPSSKTNNKRYLILTYAAEFDRVHYPLPLLHEDAPSADALRAPRWRDSNAKTRNSPPASRAATAASSPPTPPPRDSKSSARRTPNFARRTIRSGRRCGSCSASCRAPPLARRAPGRRVSEARTELAEFRSGSGAGSEREENLRAELKAVTTELRLMRRERDDANRAAQAAQTDAANAESSKRRMLARRQRNSTPRAATFRVAVRPNANSASR